jgi:hypothetical protein
VVAVAAAQHCSAAARSRERHIAWGRGVPGSEGQ